MELYDEYSDHDRVTELVSQSSDYIMQIIITFSLFCSPTYLIIYIYIYDCYNNCNVILLYILCSLLYCNNTLF